MNAAQLKALRAEYFRKAADAAKAGNVEADKAFTHAAELLLDAEHAAIKERHAQAEADREAFLEARRPGTGLHALVHGTFGSPVHH